MQYLIGFLGFGSIVVGLIGAGKVTVIQDKSDYGVQEVITVRIMNGLTQAVYVSTYHTDCTPAILEKQTDTTWVPQGSCPFLFAAFCKVFPSRGLTTLVQHHTA